ncbi:hypothetical protein Mycsm_01945 [Mycobacterium sp. JS623]|jgi:hypothetical protein|nr:hypothetical protein Mycsm_01945 [Mycobacterium sp. JS623]
MILKPKRFRRSLISVSTPERVVKSMRWKLKAFPREGAHQARRNAKSEEAAELSLRPLTR